MVLDHVCIAVRSIDRASKRFCDLFGYKELTNIVENSRQKVLVKFLRKKGSIDIKLISPAGMDSSLVQFLRKGEGLHHLCFRVDSVVKEIDSLSTEKVRVLEYPEPGEAFCNKNIAFIYAGHGLNVELIDTDCREEVKDLDQNASACD